MQQPQSKADALCAVPVPMPGIRATVSDQGLVRISHPATLKPWLARLLPASVALPLRTLELDAMGTFVWNNIDGTATVDDLAHQVAEHYSCLPAEAQQAVAMFIRQLGQRGILGLR
ncbi:PqqD family protein [Desulfomicrobium baculatum]|uniref:Coenzyme PQQ synthesis D n=1 Tax=Desulfomicrobium baculatum (strain DSM 4028 / VKM B-1378 / X) TaxID=525897 RepID=C7LVC8_DESBD|nr:PqqD family protein [Desulfomicrobium baculatum]ACU88470.1 conserved hypothetical protein [Desulfomicrobium baculatum DSM 4028]